MSRTQFQHVDQLPGYFSSYLDSSHQLYTFLFEKIPKKGFQMARK